MAGVLLRGWDATNKVWIPLQVDTNGYVKVDLSNVNLDDLADVYLPITPAESLLFYDSATLLWRARHLVDADIPAAIARDAEVVAAIADHADDTTGVHGAGANHLALFGVAGTVVTKFTPKVAATTLWRNDAITNSSFEALINGNPTSTSVVYDNDVREGSLPDITSYPQWGKVILHNVTRGNSRKITGVNTATNTITTEASTDDWANNDIITTGSQTLVYTFGHTYSYFFDIDISAEVPNTAVTMMIDLLATDLGGVGAILQNQLAFHPFEAWNVGKVTGPVLSAAYQTAMVHAVVPVISQKICVAFGPWRPICASGVLLILRLMGYWE